MKTVFYGVLFLPLFLHAQVDEGIHFEKGLSWSQVQEKAKKEHKDIFLDCFATWCVPCREMEKQVYPNAEVGRYINEHFISVKVQMDKTSGDDAETQTWYRDAAILQASFSITDFPSFLFLSADGKPVHRAVGYKDAQQFMASARDAFDTSRQYYRILSHFQAGKMDTSELKGLAREFELSDPELAGKMAADYLARISKTSLCESDNLMFMAEFSGSALVQQLAVGYFRSRSPQELFVQGNFPIIAAFRKVPEVENILLGYLGSLPKADIGTKDILTLLTLFKDEPQTMSFVDRYIRSLDTTELFSKGNIQLMKSFTVGSNDPGFGFFFHCRQRVDSVMNIGGYAKYVVDNVIQNEEIKPYCKDMRDGEGTPDWNAIAGTISRKYGTDYARRDLLWQQSAFYGYRASKYDRNWPEYIHYTIDLLQTVFADPDTAVKLSDSWINDFFYDGIFKRSNNTNQIRTALKWTREILKRDNYKDSYYIDTYSSLLYKIGDRREAIRQEEVALKIAESAKDEYYAKEYQTTLSKMKNGERIWITDNNALSETPQRKVIDSAAIMNWPILGGARTISNNGRYFMYSQYTQGDIAGELILQATDHSWRKQLHGIPVGSFSSDSKLFIFKSNDTLYLLTLGTEEVRSLPRMLSFKLSKSGEWLAYLLDEGSGDLVIDKLSTGEEKHFTGVRDFSFSPNEQVILLRTGADRKSCDGLEFVNLADGGLHTIWKKVQSEGQISLNGYSFGEPGNSLVFSLHTHLADSSQPAPVAEGVNTIWYYNSTTNSAIACIQDGMPGIPRGFFIGRGKPALSSKGNFILFRMDSTVKKPTVDGRAVQVDIWSYQDSVLQFNQSMEPDRASYMASFRLKTNHIVRVEYNDEIMGLDFGDYEMITSKSSITDYWWPSYKQKVSSLVSLTDGSRVALGVITQPVLLQNCNLIVFYDYSVHHYYSYDLRTGRKRNISRSIPGNWLEDQRSWIWDWRQRQVLGIAAVVADEQSVLVYDEYDIWRLDVDGIKAPVNITHGYGRKNGINYRLINGPGVLKQMEVHSVLVLSTYNTQTKYNGFSRIELDKIADPTSLSVGPWTIFRGSPAVAEEDEYGDNMPPLKALDTNIWIVKRETATEAPNYFLTTDFIHYAALTDIHPQQAFHWMNTELVRWKQLDGTYSEGVLYKPENFDPHKKYPVMFEYYEELSQNMYVFQVPDFDGARINIPWFVSRGYLVFTPDIHYSIASQSGKVNGDCVVNSLVSAARYLAGRPYVDARRIGIQGHSFGGGETLYLVTHSHLFAAACSASATIGNEITAYLGFTRVNGKIVAQKMDHSEDGHEKIGATLWQRPDLYIRASPVFRADQVTTPLLIMANLGDGTCDWGQSAEMFMALRRLHKKVWMLQYDNGSHAAYNQDAVDYAIRMDQFFDFYLKGALPPRWMTQGIPANLKGIETGYALDDSGAQP